ncbi:hypothetical protein Hypma_012354 [Hypsizygus marmoreus]|uniref:Uncharacterized protein n=1 Tax=Hypsizygus marmoreus TaxID=39966 RepID=A0A369KEE8_HYPMA|nr:hypothetical protein Hypma_012354 [Hypsizygus marmoreus]
MAPLIENGPPATVDITFAQPNQPFASHFVAGSRPGEEPPPPFDKLPTLSTALKAIPPIESHILTSHPAPHYAPRSPPNTPPTANMGGFLWGRLIRKHKRKKAANAQKEANQANGGASAANGGNGGHIEHQNGGTSKRERGLLPKFGINRPRPLHSLRESR